MQRVTVYGYTCTPEVARTRTKGHMQERRLLQPLWDTNIFKKSPCALNSPKCSTLAKRRGGKRVFLCLRRKITRRMPQPLGNERFHNFVNATTRALYFRAYELNDVRSANRRVETQLRERAIKLQLLFCKFHSKIFSSISCILLRL